ncbi:hypothetical protein [Rufibacter roseolus]|uniref:hypothetical protein n=1 Tax=Rufibacter roseolus TaxID=2817375 RepID=UPI001B3041B0|nr:hypothetical protein [Rufibacter roseolus]
MKGFLKPHLKTAVAFGIPIAVLAGFWVLMNLYLNAYFLHGGEAFMKGYGHLLREDFDKGLIYILLVNSIPPVLLTFLFFLLLEREVQIIAFKLLRILALFLLFLWLVYLTSKLNEGISFAFTGNKDW